MKTLQITLESAKPRNPFVAPSRARRAGVHRPRGGALRAQARTALRQELLRESAHPPHPPSSP
jgi:hypothetical protein